MDNVMSYGKIWSWPDRVYCLDRLHEELRRNSVVGFSGRYGRCEIRLADEQPSVEGAYWTVYHVSVDSGDRAREVVHVCTEVNSLLDAIEWGWQEIYKIPGI